PGVVGGGAVHALGRRLDAAVDVPGTYDDRELDPGLPDLLDLVGDGRDPLRIEPVLALAHQRFAGELQEDTVKGRRLAFGRLLVRDRLRHSARAKRTNSSTSAPSSERACATVFEVSWIHCCSASAATA